ncbi:MAG: hypothetical protein QM768_15865 [Agriterribacter sp.]
MSPAAGYSKQKAGIRLMFGSGSDFEEEQLSVEGKKLKDALYFKESMRGFDCRLENQDQYNGAIKYREAKRCFWRLIMHNSITINMLSVQPLTNQLQNSSSDVNFLC